MVDGIVTSNAEVIETNTVKLTFQISPEKFEEGLKYSYNKNKASIDIQGFRKGKVPRAVVERFYGKTVFYSDAVDYVFDKLYVYVLREHKLNPVQNPKVDVKEISAEAGVSFEVEMIVEPLVKVSDYTGITYEPFETAATDAEVDQAIGRDREKNARVLTVDDRAAQDGDTVIIDFKGTIDGEPFDNGESEDFELVLGSKSFIDDFEEQIIGMNTNDVKDVDVTFPEEYQQAPELAGKPARFAVTLKEIRVKEYPELDDDFAQDVSDYDTFDEYKADVTKKITDNKEKFADGRKQEQIVKKLIEKIEGDIPQVMFDSMSDRIYEEYKNNIKSKGIDYEIYLQYSGDNDERVRSSAKDDADMRIRSRLALTAVAAQENIEITDEDINEEITRMAEQYGMEKDKLEKSIGDIERDRLSDDLKVQKALKFVVDSAVCDETLIKAEIPPEESVGAEIAEEDEEE